MIRATYKEQVVSLLAGWGIEFEIIEGDREETISEVTDNAVTTRTVKRPHSAIHIRKSYLTFDENGELKK